MITEKQRELAKYFSSMHKKAGMFVLPNAWDPGSAYVFEKQGFQAVATSSAGVAYALGYPDGQEITLEDLIHCAGQIVRRISIPLSVDFERGYGETPETVTENARCLFNSGAVGLNIEDGKSDGSLDDLEDICGKVRALSELKKELDLDFVINARTCTYWLNVGDEKTKLKIALERGEAFRRAGADCVFIPGALDRETAEKLVTGIQLPVNIILNGKFHDFDGLDGMGVRRLSVGSGPVRSVYNHLISLAEDLRRGEVKKIFDHGFSYGEANQYFTKY